MEDSIDRYLGRLESEDLERVVDRLNELAGEPGWADLMTLVEVYRNKVISQLVAIPMKEAVAYAYPAGQIKGMEDFLSVIAKANKKREDVRAAVRAGRQ